MHKNMKRPIVYPALRDWLDETHVSLTMLADDTGLMLNTVRSFAQGTRDVRISTAVTISEYTGIPIGELLQK